MADISKHTSKFQGLEVGTIISWLLGILSFGLFGILLVEVVIQFVTPTSLHRLQLVQDVELPSVVVPQAGNPPIQAIRADRFDFQALDPQTGLLFIAHPGPNVKRLPDILRQANLSPDTKIRRSVVVLDTTTNTPLGVVDIPNSRGIAVASGSQKVYVADLDDSKIYVINEQTCKPVQPAQSACSIIAQIPVKLHPDSLEYDPDHNHILAAGQDNADITKGDEVVIDAHIDRVVQTISLGAVTVGHTRYDRPSRRIFVAVSTGTQSELIVIDPVTAALGAPLILPSGCQNAHGLSIDSQQQVAFIACPDPSDVPSTQNIMMVDIHAMRPIGGLAQVGIRPDVVALDTRLHVLFVGCATAISVFNEKNASSGSLPKFGKDYIVSNGTSHSIAIDENTHNIYIPLIDVGGRPLMRIEHFDPNGNV